MKIKEETTVDRRARFLSSGSRSAKFSMSRVAPEHFLHDSAQSQKVLGQEGVVPLSAVRWMGLCDLNCSLTLSCGHSPALWWELSTARSSSGLQPGCLPAVGPVRPDTEPGFCFSTSRPCCVWSSAREQRTPAFQVASGWSPVPEWCLPCLETSPRAHGWV